jgi:hypothetical protein
MKKTSDSNKHLLNLEIQNHHEIHKDPSKDKRIHYALTVTFTQPRHKNRTEEECAKIMNALFKIMCETFVSKRRYKEMNSQITLTALLESQSKKDNERHAHYHALLSISRKFAPNVDDFCYPNSLKKLHRIEKVLPRVIKTSDLQRAIDDVQQHSVERWNAYILKNHHSESSLLLFKA